MADQIPSFDEFKKSTATGEIPTFDEFKRGAQPSTGQYLLETAKNVPGSAWNAAKNLGNAVMHPSDTAEGLLNLGTGLAQKVLPEKFSAGAGNDKRPMVDAMGNAIKQRYGSLDAIKKTFHDDPVGVAADASMLIGGASGLARGTAGAAELANLPRTASGLRTAANVAGTASDIVNPMTLPLKAAGGVDKAIGKGLVNSALDLRGKTSRYGATPAKAMLEETSGLTPAAVKRSATERVGQLSQELDALAAKADANGTQLSLAPARKVIEDQIAQIKKDNGLTSDFEPMLDQLIKPRPGFGGNVTPGPLLLKQPAGFAAQPKVVQGPSTVSEFQDPSQFRGMKHQFGEDWTKFDAGVPLKDEVRALGNKAYHELSSEFNRGVPGAQPKNQLIQSLVPVTQGAQRADEAAGLIQRGVNRATRPTGGMAATLFGMHEAGIPGALGVLGVQEALSSPAAKIALARSLYGTGKAVGSPLARRSINVLGAPLTDQLIQEKK